MSSLPEPAGTSERLAVPDFISLQRKCTCRFWTRQGFVQAVANQYRVTGREVLNDKHLMVQEEIRFYGSWGIIRQCGKCVGI